MKRIAFKTIKFGSLSKAERNRKIMTNGKRKLGKFILQDLQSIVSTSYAKTRFNFASKIDSFEIAQRVVELTD